jgi:Tol biopolymer transport system component
VVRNNQGKETVITGANESGFEPSWAPMGQRLAFWAETRDVQSIRVYDLTMDQSVNVTNIVAPTTNLKKESTRGYHNVCPAWSFDAGEIYYAASAGTWDQIFKVGLSDRKVTRLTDANIPPPYICPRVMTNYEVSR